MTKSIAIWKVLLYDKIVIYCSWKRRYTFPTKTGKPTITEKQTLLNSCKGLYSDYFIQQENRLQKRNQYEASCSEKDQGRPSVWLEALGAIPFVCILCHRRHSVGCCIPWKYRACSKGRSPIYSVGYTPGRGT